VRLRDINRLRMQSVMAVFLGLAVSFSYITVQRGAAVVVALMNGGGAKRQGQQRRRSCRQKQRSC